MPQGALEIYEVGPTTVVGFGGRNPLDDVNLSAFRADLVTLVKQHETKILAFDLTGVRLVPSGLLGLLASMRREGVGCISTTRRPTCERSCEQPTSIASCRFMNWRSTGVDGSTDVRITFSMTEEPRVGVCRDLVSA
jgi:hypothetical protein